MDDVGSRTTCSSKFKQRLNQTKFTILFSNSKVASITYPAISAFVSIHSTPDQQGVVQGMVTGMRGLCNGIGPAMFGVIFYLFNVDLNDESKNVNSIYYNEKTGLSNSSMVHYQNENGIVVGQNYDNNFLTQFMPGPPFVFGSLMVSGDFL